MSIIAPLHRALAGGCRKGTVITELPAVAPDVPGARHRRHAAGAGPPRPRPGVPSGRSSVPRCLPSSSR